MKKHRLMKIVMKIVMETMTNIIQGDNYLITGSTVLKLRYIKDIDIICYTKDILVETTGDDYIRSTIIGGKRYEFLLADNQESLQLFLREKEKFTPEEIYYCLKRGHIHIAGRKQENWEKHMFDLNILKKIIGQERLVELKKYVYLHKKSTDERIKQRTPRLNGVSKDKFFDDKVVKFIDHDLIHEAVAYDTVPAYSKMQKDETVECHKDLWMIMSYEEKLQCVAEEAMVIAIERHLLPAKMNNTFGKPEFLSFKWALWRICTTLCSGWFRQFAINNYCDVLNMYDEKKITQVVDQITEHLIIMPHVK